MKTREEKIVDTITTEGFEFKGRKFKTLTTRTLLILEKFKSPYYKGGDDALKGLMDLLFVCGTDPRLVQNLTQEEFDNAVFDFADEFNQDDMNKLTELISNLNKDSQSTVVEVRDTSEKKQ